MEGREDGRTQGRKDGRMKGCKDRRMDGRFVETRILYTHTTYLINLC